MKSKPKSKLSVKSMPFKNSAENHRVQRNLGEKGGGGKEKGEMTAHGRVAGNISEKRGSRRNREGTHLCVFFFFNKNNSIRELN